MKIYKPFFFLFFILIYTNVLALPNINDTIRKDTYIKVGFFPNVFRLFSGNNLIDKDFFNCYLEVEYEMRGKFSFGSIINYYSSKKYGFEPLTFYKELWDYPYYLPSSGWAIQVSPLVKYSLYKKNRINAKVSLGTGYIFSLYNKEFFLSKKLNMLIFETGINLQYRLNKLLSIEYKPFIFSFYKVINGNSYNGIYQSFSVNIKL